MTRRAPRPSGLRSGVLLGLLPAFVLLPALGACGAADDRPAASGEDAGAPGGAQGGSARAGSLEIRDAVATEPVTGERSALYLTVADVSGAGDVLVGLEVARAGRASLHRTERTGATGDGAGGMTMRPVDSLIVQPGDRLLMRPGGIHGMLEELEGRWRAGDTVEVTLRFRQAGSVELRAPVVGYDALDRLFPPEGGGG